MNEIKIKKEKLKILIVASEVVPFAKTGGLADVTGALPKAFKKLGHDVRVVLPKYKCISDEKFNIIDTGKRVVVDIALVKHIGVIKQSFFPGTEIPVYFIDNDEFFNRDELYRTPYGEYWDNAERFIFFSRAVIEMLKEIDFIPDVVHCNDWHTGLIPVYLKTIYKNIGDNIATIYSIHNIAYQGYTDKEKLSHAGLPWELWTMDKLEFYGGINFMKGGIVFSDIINTVSENYKKETETPEFGYNLDGVLRCRNSDYFGVINGVDYEIWDPAIDKYIDVNFDIKTIHLKNEMKKILLQEIGLKYFENVPLFCMVSRLDAQKGIDFIVSIMDEMLKMNLQFVILGTGDKWYHDILYDFKNKYPEKFSIHFKFDNILAHKIYAGADIFLMPSYFEPCGLGQLIALKYGTVPIVRAIGGLKDTIKQFNFRTKQGNGFLFYGNNPMDLLQVIRIAVDTYKNKSVWMKLIENGMKENFSWEHSAQEYVKLYYKAMEKHNNKDVR
ncbi:MAG: glycogen synthase GlgA [Candidatus Goldbacteria bacterium]|nr:glycogen synthase GlgA [Candidatus Goldiibacteriota bacterium]